VEKDNKLALGSLFSIPDLRDYVAKTVKTTFPKTFELGIMPDVKNQGTVGSCVAHSLATVTEYFNEKETGKFIEMSTGYVYGNRLLSTYKGSGMYLRDAIKTLAKFGNVPFTDFPHNVEVPYAIAEYEKVADKLENVGLNYKIESYFKFKDDESIKAHLMDGNLVVFAMKWFDDIKIRDGVMITSEKTSKKTGGHCMVIYGWNETGWLVQNSWGKIWGNNGTFILPYGVSRKETWGLKDAKSDSSLVLKKPFKTKFGAKIAKVIHSIISVFYNLKNRSK
jgi:C1A family cysteine protease